MKEVPVYEIVCGEPELEKNGDLDEILLTLRLSSTAPTPVRMRRGWRGCPKRDSTSISIFEALHVPDSNILIQAVAGSGKTTTLIEGLRHAPGTALFMAFNKSIAEDIRGKAPKGDVKTLNALVIVPAPKFTCFRT